MFTKRFGDSSAVVSHSWSWDSLRPSESFESPSRIPLWNLCGCWRRSVDSMIPHGLLRLMNILKGFFESFWHPTPFLDAFYNDSLRFSAIWWYFWVLLSFLTRITVIMFAILTIFFEALSVDHSETIWDSHHRLFWLNWVEFQLGELNWNEWQKDAAVGDQQTPQQQ